MTVTDERMVEASSWCLHALECEAPHVTGGSGVLVVEDFKLNGRTFEAELVGERGQRYGRALTALAMGHWAVLEEACFQMELDQLLASARTK